MRSRDQSLFFFAASNLVEQKWKTQSIICDLFGTFAVDLLANVFDVLRADLKEDRAKEIFLEYRTTMIILPFLKSSNKTIVAGAVDVFLQMSMESGNHGD